MPYITKEQVSEIRTALKAAFPEIKFSVKRKAAMSVTVAIIQAPHHPLANNSDYHQLGTNTDKDDKRLSPYGSSIIPAICTIIDKDNRTAFHDGDYGAVPNYYSRLDIGQWDRPFTLK